MAEARHPQRKVIELDRTSTDDDGQSPMARAAAMPGRKPYTWGGIPGPVIGSPEEIAAREDSDDGR